MMIDELLARSRELELEVLSFLDLGTYNKSEKSEASRIACSISIEHSISLKRLIELKLFTSAIALIRLQYEAVVRSQWIYHVASESDISKVWNELTPETADAGNKLPTLSEMIKNLDNSSLSSSTLDMLKECKEYSWKPTSSFIHCGIHAVNRHDKGYPSKLIEQNIRQSNSLLFIAAMMLAQLAQNQQTANKIRTLQFYFSDDLTNLKKTEQEE